MKRAFVVDSSAAVDINILAKEHVYEIPISINFNNGEEYVVSGDQTNVADFFRRLDREDPLPKTAQPALSVYYDVFDQCLADGVSDVFVILLAQAISGSYQSACMVAKEYEGRLNIHVLDTGSVASWNAYLLDVLLAMDEAGHYSTEEMLAVMETLIQDTYFLLYVQDLDYLVKGGRAGASAALLGKILNITPLIIMKEDGKFYPLDRLRSKKKLYRRIKKEIENHREKAISHQDLYQIRVLHADNETEARDLRAYLKTEYPNTSITISTISPIIGVHIGPGAVAVAALPYIKGHEDLPMSASNQQGHFEGGQGEC